MRSIQSRGSRQGYLGLRGDAVEQENKLIKIRFLADLTKQHGKLKLRLDIVPGRDVYCSLSKKDYANLEEILDSEEQLALETFEFLGGVNNGKH